MQCPRCQWTNYNGAQFCTQCGMPLSPAQPSPMKKGGLACLRALCYYILFISVQVAVMVVYEFAVILQNMGGYITNGTFDAERYYEEMMDLLMAQLTDNLHTVMILSALFTVLILFLSFHLRHKNPLAEMHIRKISGKNAVLAVVFGASLQVFVAVTLSLIPLPQSLVDSFAQNNELLSGGSIAIQFINVALLTPVIEELIFRGLVFTRLRRGMRPVLALILSTVIFGWAHGHIISFVYAGLLGIVLALLMKKNNDSVLAPIFCHAGFNGASYLLDRIEEITLPVFALYFAAMAAAVVCGYLLLRPARSETEE